MAKRTLLELVNGVLKNIGESTIANFDSMTTMVQLCFDKINDSIIEIAGLGAWLQLEASGTGTMVTGTNTFAAATDLLMEDEASFRIPDNDGSFLHYYKTPVEWDADYPKGITTERQGWPSGIMRYNETFHLNNLPTATQNGKKIYYRYKQRPVLLTTATATGTCWIPEQMDDLVLINLATYKVMDYKGNPEAQSYYARVFGVDNDKTGSKQGYLNLMKKLFSAPRIRINPTVQFEFEHTGRKSAAYHRLVE